MIKKIFLLSLIITSLFIGCSDDSDPSNDNDNNGSSGSNTTTPVSLRSQVLVNWADNFIIPNYQNLSNKLSNLQTSVFNFCSNPDQFGLEEVRENWLQAYKSWQYVEMFNIGPAEQFFYHYKMNIYPANTNDIEAFIESGDFSNLNNPLFNAAQGFPAMDYMLFGIAQNDSSIINFYNDLDSNYNPYLLDITDRMVSNTDNVLTEWDSYRDSFVASTENNATSSINKMTNDFIYYYEKGFRANKIGIPIGVFSNGNNFPSKFEAYHKQDVSGILGLEAFDAIKAFFNGNDNPSLKHLIDAAAVGDLINLSSEINEQFDNAYTELQGLNVNFVEQLQIGLGQLNSTYDEIQAGTVLLKTDMLSVLQIASDYIDADGD